MVRAMLRWELPGRLRPVRVGVGGRGAGGQCTRRRQRPIAGCLCRRRHVAAAVLPAWVSVSRRAGERSGAADSVLCRLEMKVTTR